jgi:hypothetical protein
VNVITRELVTREAAEAASLVTSRAQATRHRVAAAALLDRARLRLSLVSSVRWAPVRRVREALEARLGDRIAALEVQVDAFTARCLAFGDAW